MLAALVSTLVLLSTGVILLSNAGVTGFFLAKHPQGERAMGLVVPFIALIIAALVVTAASLLVCFLPGSKLVGPWPESRIASSAAIVGVSFGVVLAAFMAFTVWAEPVIVTSSVRSLTTLFGNLAGLAGPVVLAAVLLFAAWISPEWIDAHPRSPIAIRVMCWYLVVVATMGYAMGGIAVGVPAIVRFRQAHAAEANLTAEDKALRDHYRSAPVDELLRDQLAKFSPEAPLWSIVIFFVRSPGDRKLNTECERLLIERCQRVPDMDRQLLECMTSDQYVYCGGACELVRLAPMGLIKSHEKSWAKAVAAGIDHTAEAMTMRPAWLSETFNSNPDPLEHIRTLLSAAERFKGLASEAPITAAINRLASAANELNRDKKREKLCGVLKRAGHPVPAEELPAPTR